MMRRLLSGFALLLFLAQAAPAAQDGNWSFEVKLGQMESADARWPQFYGDDSFRAYLFSVGYRLSRQFEVGIEVGYHDDQGRGFAPGHGVLAGAVDYRLYPLHAQLTWRGVFRRDQWLVPYVGAGLSRLYYRVEVEQQPDISGSVNGHQYRAGLQLLLDNLDRAAAAALEDDGIENTYFFIEFQRTEASVNGTELGGKTYVGGVRFEF